MPSKQPGIVRTLAIVLISAAMIVVGVWLTRELNRPSLPTPTATYVLPTPIATPTLMVKKAKTLTVAFYNTEGINYWQPGITPKLLRSLGSSRPAALWIDPAGTQVFYRLDDSQERGLYSVYIPNGEKRLWVTNADLERFTPEIVSRLDHLEFLPDTNALIFNTHPQEGTALQTVENQDMYRLDLNSGELTTLLPFGTGGLDFSISPDGQWLALLDADKIEIMRPDGTDRRIVLTFDAVLPRQTDVYSTYPEYAAGGSYYPDVRWMPDSSGFWVLIPPADLYSGGRGATRLLQVSLQGEIHLLAEIVSPVTLGASFNLSPDGQKLVYIDGSDYSFWIYTVDSGAKEALGNLDTSKTYTFFGWSPDSKYCVFEESSGTPSLSSGPVFVFVQPGQTALRLSGGTYPLVWLDAQHFWGFAADGALTELAILGLDGSTTPVGKISFPYLFDFALPAP